MRFIPSDQSYGDAGGSGATSSYVDVFDVQGTGPFRVYSDGAVKLMSTGKTWTPGSSNYDLVVANLNDVSGNGDKMSKVMGHEAHAQAVATGRPQQVAQASAPSRTPGGVPALPATVSQAPVPVFKRVWFWPLVVLTGATAVGGAIYLVRMKPKTAKDMEKTARKMAKSAEAEARVRYAQASKLVRG